MRDYNDKKGQAMVELAIFGSIILVMFGILLSFIQRFNNQQYVQMETFRRALEKACTYQGEESEGAGASVQFTLLTDRRQAEVSGGFRKGNANTFSASSNVFWAVPKVGAQSESLIAYRVNEDERTRNYEEFVPEEEADNWSFRTEDMASSSDLDFNETITKQETPRAITNTRDSTLQETRIVTIPYTIREKDDDDDDENDVVVGQGTFWEGEGGPNGELIQRLYRDSSDGQYKYSSEAPEDATIERSKIWVTAR